MNTDCYLNTYLVVFHHGLQAAGGHYTCDAYHASFKRWIRHDDTIARIISDKEV